MGASEREACCLEEESLAKPIQAKFSLAKSSQAKSSLA